MKLGSRDELKRPNACVLILLMLIPVLALVTIADNVAVAACSCPYGGSYRSSIYTKLCGWQYNVCVSFDYNCANDYQAVCATTQTPATTSGAVPTTPAKTCSNNCPYGGQYYSSIYTSLCGWEYNVCVTWDNNCADDYQAVCATTQTPTTASTATIKTGTACGYIEIMMGQCPSYSPYSQGYQPSTTTAPSSAKLYTVDLILKARYSYVSIAGWKIYVDNGYVGQTDSLGRLTITDVTSGSHKFTLKHATWGTYYSTYNVNSDGELTLTVG
jgi:hypothetical protein